MIHKENPVDYKVLDVIKKRWSPRAFAKKSISNHDILTMLEAARWTASAFNEQPWRFIVAKKEDKQKYAKLLACLREGNQSWATNAPLLILAVAKKTFSNTNGENKLARYDLGQAVSALVLQASELNIYSHQMAGIYPEKAKSAYNLADGYEAVTAIALGYLGDIEQLPEDLQAREKSERIRKTLAEITIETDLEI